MALTDIVSRYGRKAKAATLAAVLGATGAVSDAYSQVVLSFQGPQNVQVGVPTEYNFVINTHNTDMSTEQIGTIAWNFNLQNGSSVAPTINDIHIPSSNYVFSGFNSNWESIDSNSGIAESIQSSGPTNIQDKYFGSVNVTFNQSGSHSFDYSFAVIENIDNINLDYESSSFNVNVAAVPEPSTYALIGGAAALGAAAVLRGRRKQREERKAN